MNLRTNGLGGLPLVTGTLSTLGVGRGTDLQLVEFILCGWESKARMEAITSRPFLLSQWRVRPRTAAQASHITSQHAEADKAKVLLTAIMS